MKRKCDKCDQEATVHEVTIKGGQKLEKHLCESCAREDGIAIQAHQPISELITKFVMSQGGVEKGAGAGEESKVSGCPECGMSFAEFRQQGVLGCPGCYAAFEEQLGPLIERAHEGGTHHLGKAPRRAGGSIDRNQRIVAIRKQLSDAIEAEQYERAAALRDQLLGVEKDPPGQGRATRIRGGSAAKAPAKGTAGDHEGEAEGSSSGVEGGSGGGGGNGEGEGRG